MTFDNIYPGLQIKASLRTDIMTILTEIWPVIPVIFGKKSIIIFWRASARFYQSLFFDQLLVWILVYSHFVKIARRSAFECQLEWTHFGHPRVNRKPWTKQEDKMILKLTKGKDYVNWNLAAQSLQVCDAKCQWWWWAWKTSIKVIIIIVVPYNIVQK